MNQLDQDTRLVSELPFGIDAAPDERQGVVEEVRRLLTRYGCTIADDIAKLGCTGVMHKQPADANSRALGHVASAIRDAKFLRSGVAGGGVGLPCFVPINRYCLVHETFGGLEPGQAQRYPEEVEKISRELTPAEHARVVIIERARRVDEGNLAKTTRRAVDVLTVHDKDTQQALREEFGDGADVPLPISVLAQSAVAPWKCPTHTERNWTCRYCMAQAVVEGPLEPMFLLSCDSGGRADGTDRRVSGSAVASALLPFDLGGAQQVHVYVLAKELTQKLA